MLTVYRIEQLNNRLRLHCGCAKNMEIDRFEIESTAQPLVIGWVDVLLCDQLVFRGPYNWFTRTGVGLLVRSYMSLTIDCQVCNGHEPWHDAATIQLNVNAWDVDGKKCDVQHRLTIAERERE